MSARALVNIDAALFLAVVAFLFLRPGRASTVTSAKGSSWWCWLPVLLGMAVYLSCLPYPFVFDDYTHLSNAAAEGWTPMLSRVLWQHPSGGDMFFRPLGYASYWLNFRWAGFHPIPWHAYGVALHLVNTLLVFALSRKLFATLIPALTASLVFALHGAHVEAVCWMAAQFDLLATIFVLLALLLALRRNFVAVAACSVLACLTKESAYALPALIVCSAFLMPDSRRRGTPYHLVKRKLRWNQFVGFAPATPGFNALWQTAWGAGRLRTDPRVRTRGSARVASLRSPILCAGVSIVTKIRSSLAELLGL